MAWCLIPKKADEFLNKLKSGEINPAKLADMTSAERREFFSQFGDENSKNINALFESKLLLKNQKAGMITWAKKISGLSKDAKRDIVSKINRLEDVLSPKETDEFLEDLASKKLNVDVTKEEADQIYKLAKDTETKLTKIADDSPIRSTERMEYGISKVVFEKYLQLLKKGTPSAKAWITEYIENPSKVIFDLAGATKSMLATLDNSFFGRQGMKVLFSNPTTWAKSFVKSFSDMGKELRGIDAMDAIKADMFSRPNAINGVYDTAKLDIHGITEEAFPTSVPEKIPGFGRLFKASESAFSGAALRMRADLADKYFKQASKQGIEMTDKVQMEGIGNLINSMTGRGNIGRLGVFGKEINAAFFSIKFLKSNGDTLFGGMKNLAKYPFKKGTMTFAEKKSAENLLKITGGIASVLTISEMLYPGSVELDPRSTDFGKIKINNTRFDVTGGMGSLAVLASRITPTYHNGELGFWSKSSTSGKWTNLTAGKYGQRSATDVIIDMLFLNKLSPLAGLARDVWKGEHFGGKEITPLSIVKNLTVPLSIQNLEELLKDKNSAPVVRSVILEFLGISANTYGESKPKIKSIK